MSERHTATGEGRVDLQLEAELERPRDGHARPAPRSHPADDLSICPCCGGDFVYPTNWKQVGRLQWGVDLRCAECEWNGGGVFQQELVDRFDESLDEAMQSVLEDLELLTRANMEEQIERFVTAINADLILPEDF